MEWRFYDGQSKGCIGGESKRVVSESLGSGGGFIMKEISKSSCKVVLVTKDFEFFETL